MANKIYHYPLWLRIWHLLNAVLCFGLMLTGISLQYSGTNYNIFEFDTSVLIHNICGILLSANYLFYFIKNLISGNIKFYLPDMKSFVSDSIKQARYYLIGIFKGEEHPFEIDEKRKFNPLQQITYLIIMYFFFPVIIITGILFMFPTIFLDAESNILLVNAIIHSSAGFVINLFMIGHIYLGTTGKKISSNFKAIATGWHEH